MQGSTLRRALMLASALLSAAHAQLVTHNESCSHAEGTCGKAQSVMMTGLPPLLLDSDQALLGQIDKDFGSAAMRPAPFPTFLPADTFGMASAVKGLPQPALHRAQGSPMTTAGAGAMQTLGMF
ncbi:MAG: hypothetical protein ACPIOQ_60780 [Promethearchaeia archaeon]